MQSHPVNLALPSLPVPEGAAVASCYDVLQASEKVITMVGSRADHMLCHQNGALTKCPISHHSRCFWVADDSNEVRKI